MKDKKEFVNFDEDQIKELEEREKQLGVNQDVNEKTSEEQEEKQEESKSSQKKLFVEEPKDNNVGYIELNKEIIPSAAMFYPENSTFRIRGGQTTEIRTFSSYAQKDAYTINQSINGILNPTVKYSVGPKQYSTNYMLEMDKIFFLLAVRDLTFYHIPNKIKNPSSCPKCGQACGIEIFTSNTVFFEEDQNLSNFYNASKRCYSFNFNDGETLEIKPPMILTTSVIENYISNKRRKGNKVEVDILENIKYLNLDWENMTEDRLDNQILETYKWSTEKYSLFLKVIEDFKKQMVNKTIDNCNSCGAEVTVPFQFPSGLLSIFLVSDPYRFAK